MYYTKLNGEQRSRFLSAPQTLAPPIVRHLICSATQVAELRRILGPSFTADQARGVISAAAGEGALFARKAADKLRSSAASPDLDKLFLECFGVGRKHVPSWRPAGQLWNVGGVVRTRFERAAGLLTGGTIHYSCFGYPWGDWPKHLAKGDYAMKVPPGKYRVAFGEDFWKEWVSGSSSSPPAFLLGAALIIYFGPMLTGRINAPKTVLVFSYLRFALTLAEVEIPAWVIDPASWFAPKKAVPAPTVTPPQSGSGTATRPPRLRLTDEELERILGGKPKDPLDARIEWIIKQVPPTKSARPPLKDLVREKFNEKLNETMNKVGIPKRLQPYVRKAAHGAVERGSKLVLEESLSQMGVTDKETIEAITGAVERLGQQSP